MSLFVSIADEVWPVDLHPGSRTAGGAPVSLADDRLTIGEDTHAAVVARDGDILWVHLDGATHALTVRDPVDHYAGQAEDGGDAVIRAPMPGGVVQVLATLGDVVETGAVLMIIESMKLETSIRAGRPGVIEAIHVEQGQTFERDALLVTLASET